MAVLKLFLASTLCLVLCSCATKGGASLGPTKIVLIGDSTMAQKRDEARPETGWGEALAAFFDGSVTVENHALNGRSSKSFIDEGHWREAIGSLGSGDTLVVQFGHNDEKHKDPRRFTEAWEGYSENLRRFAREAMAKGANVVIASSICRRKFLEDGSLADTHGQYPAAAEAVAEEFGVAFVDMEALSRALLIELGPERSVALFLHLRAGESESHPEGKVDDTHLRAEGARAHAQLFVNALQVAKHPLARRLRPAL